MLTIDLNTAIGTKFTKNNFNFTTQLTSVFIALLSAFISSWVSDFEEEAVAELVLVGQFGTVWSDSSRIGGGRRLCTTRLRAPQSEILTFEEFPAPGEAEHRPELLLAFSSPDLSPRWGRLVVDPSDDVWLEIVVYSIGTKPYCITVILFY